MREMGTARTSSNMKKMYMVSRALSLSLSLTFSVSHSVCVLTHFFLLYADSRCRIDICYIYNNFPAFDSLTLSLTLLLFSSSLLLFYSLIIWQKTQIHWIPSRASARCMTAVDQCVGQSVGQWSKNIQIITTTMTTAITTITILRTAL